MEIPKEIERKWMFLVSKKNKKNIIEKADEMQEIRQFYTEISKEKEVRYRNIGIEFWKTIKTPTTNPNIRLELTESIPQYEFQEQFDHKIGVLVEKRRYIIRRNSIKFEIDMYKNPLLQGKAILEVEFPSNVDAESFTIPKEILDEFITDPIEITKEERFKNKNIAQLGKFTIKDS